MIFVLVLMPSVVGAAELVRMTCRRRLTAPLSAAPTPDGAPADLAAVRGVVGESVAA